MHLMTGSHGHPLPSQEGVTLHLQTTAQDRLISAGEALQLHGLLPMTAGSRLPAALYLPYRRHCQLYWYVPMIPPLVSASLRQR